MKPLVGESLVTEAQYAKLTESIPRSSAFLEIGTWHGRTAARLADDHPDCLIVSVDPFIGWTGSPCDPNFYLHNKRPNMRGFIGTVQQDEEEYPGVVQSVGEFCEQTKFRIVSRTDERRSLVEVARV